MSDNYSVRGIENHTSRLIILPPTYTFPKGVRLVPGLNRVPELYFEEAEQYELPEREIESFGRKVKVPARKPITEALADLQKPLYRAENKATGASASARRFRGVNGPYSGPQITIYRDPLAIEGREDGPPPPDFLPEDKKQARAIIEVTTDRAALKKWAGQGRGEIAQAAAAKLLALGNG
ncbi:MAG: hypothetical protein RLZZ450_64 [Pseudomonadota bacterium]|jgi:hypothetical protein